MWLNQLNGVVSFAWQCMVIPLRLSHHIVPRLMACRVLAMPMASQIKAVHSPMRYRMAAFSQVKGCHLSLRSSVSEVAAAAACCAAFVSATIVATGSVASATSISFSIVKRTVKSGNIADTATIPNNILRLSDANVSLRNSSVNGM